MTKWLNIQLLTAAVLSLGGLALLFCGVAIEPQGQIHESLLIGFGEVATFAGALFGIDYTYKQKYNNESYAHTNHHSHASAAKGESDRRDAESADLPVLADKDP